MVVYIDSATTNIHPVHLFLSERAAAAEFLHFMISTEAQDELLRSDIQPGAEAMLVCLALVGCPKKPPTEMGRPPQGDMQMKQGGNQTGEAAATENYAAPEAEMNAATCPTALVVVACLAPALALYHQPAEVGFRHQ